MIPENGASMGDATRTREDKSESICDSCNKEYPGCGNTPEQCKQAFPDENAELLIKIRKGSIW